jgi:peptidoglycan/LPS O-acetylase OafA/YrhL
MGASVLLDVVRFLAAVAVVATHSVEQRMHTGWQPHVEWGDMAVPVFFVLSGFVIRYVTRLREHTMRDYLIDRASRIYSIVLPSMALTIVLAIACYFLDRARFTHDWLGYCTSPVTRTFVNLTFFSQAWGHNSVPFINVPYWSLGYECVYYVLYAFVLFWQGWRRALAFLVLAVAIGPQVMFLLPIWWLGCWMYDAYERARVRPVAVRSALAAVAMWITAGIVQAVRGSYAILSAPYTFIEWAAVLPNPLLWVRQPTEYRATMFAFATGLVTAAMLFVLLLALEPVRIAKDNVWAARIRRIADGTFAIYLFHYPILLLASFAGLLRASAPVRNVCVITCIVALLTASAVPLDRLKDAMRRWLRRRFPVRQVQPQPIAAGTLG